MHNIDRAMFELEHPAYETFEGGYESSDREGEALETELATELLEVSSEGELEQFLGDLVKSAASAVRGFASSPTGKALGGMLTKAAKQVLPQVGQAVGNLVAPGVGGALGQRAGQWLGGQLELEGLSAEDRELEVARAVVRLGQDATRSAIAAGPAVPPQQAATNAVIAAARRQLPGLVPVLVAGGSPGAGQRPDSGRWVRRGRRIVLLDV